MLADFIPITRGIAEPLPPSRCRQRQGQRGVESGDAGDSGIWMARGGFHHS